MDDIRIPNQATYSPVSLLELGLAAPLLSRLLLRTTLPGAALQTAALAVYAASAADDWMARRGVRRIDFQAAFGADVRTLPDVPAAHRRHEVATLAARLNEGFTPHRIPRRDLVRIVDRRLTDRIAAITGQRVRTSTEIRSFSLLGLAFPFALGTSDILSGDVAILRDTGILEPHVVAHELAHRKGYWKELHAQVLAYLALADADHPVLRQAALAERLARQLAILARHDPDRPGDPGSDPGPDADPGTDSRTVPHADPDPDPHGGSGRRPGHRPRPATETERFRRLVRDAGLRPELEQAFLRVRPPRDPVTAALSDAMKELYDLRLRATGQNGVSDYDAGFTALLYALERGPHGHRAAAPPGRVWPRSDRPSAE